MNLQRREEISALLAEPVTGEAGQALEYRDALMECRAHIDALEQTAAERVIARGAVIAPHTFGELVNQVRDIANQYAGTEQLREQIAYALAPHFERDAGPTPDYTGEGSAWVPPVEARAVVVPELTDTETIEVHGFAIRNGCGSNSCYVRKPGVGTNGPCTCIPRFVGVGTRIKLISALRANQGGAAT